MNDVPSANWNAGSDENPCGWTISRCRYRKFSSPCCVRSVSHGNRDRSSMAAIAFGTSAVANPNQSVAQYIIPNCPAICCCGLELTSPAPPNSPCPYSTGRRS